MNIFVTGATGFIGTHVAKEMFNAGHKVIGLARSDAGARRLTDIGVNVHRGSLEDLDCLRSGAADADAVIHLGFVHDFSKFQENCEIDRQAIEALGSVLAGTGRPLIITSGLVPAEAPGQLSTEANIVPPDFPTPRVSEQTALALQAKKVSSAVVRLPQVHNTIKQGLVTYAIEIAREKRISAYVGDGQSRWAAAHVTDVARLYRLAIEKHKSGAIYHAVAEEGIRMRDIAEAIGRSLGMSAVSISPEEVREHFGWLGMFVERDLPASSAITREKLGWIPTGPGLIADIERINAQ
ncbi:SDR family oxidoreductase [Oryzomonas sagensis]|uniref:SDR family oxidoreductase n=1 Tax=Oryzomonas sagensis TaxID=2603857 RepID=A0ABQ6TPX3_9BACT|nr:SDR family oxidoreductase [Oryzomonas sagensis]KAB0670465.1 SDR family oxidoreductase [Oryzomonas sagensis]